MRIDQKAQFSVYPELFHPTYQAVHEVGQKLLSGIPVEIAVLDDSANLDRVKAVDLNAAYMIDNRLPRYEATLIQQKMAGIVLPRLPYASGMVESAVAEGSQKSLASKNFLRRAFRRTYEDAVREQNEIEAGALEVSKDFAMLRRSARLIVSNELGQVFDAEVAQVAMEGEIKINGESLVFSENGIATIANFISGKYERADESHSISSLVPGVVKGDSFGDLKNRLLLPGQTGVNASVHPEEFAGVLAAIEAQQFRL